MSAIKGQAKAELSDFGKYVGLGLVEVVAVNPEKSELNKLFGKEDSDNDKPIEYVGEDNDGNTKSRIAFWVKEQKTGKLFAHNVTLINKERTNQAGDKNQWINDVLDTGWDSTGDNLPDFFTSFMSKEDEILGPKAFRKAVIGEEALGIFIKAWLGKLNFNKPGAEVILDRKKLFAGNFKDLRSILEEPLITPFVALFGVKTDEDDSSKQYQQIFPRGFLPANFIKHINNGMKWPNDYTRKQWASFQKKVEGVDGKYGWDSYYEFAPIHEYDPSVDVAAQGTPKEAITNVNDNY